MGFPRQEYWSGLPFPPASHLCILLLVLILCWFYHRHRGLSKSSFSVHGLWKLLLHSILKVPWWLSGKESACQCRRREFDLWVEKIPWRWEWQCTPVFLPGRSHGQRSLKGYSPRHCRESDMIERLSMHTHNIHDKAKSISRYSTIKWQTTD